ncbi:MAG: glycosyltransferase family 4 protein [Ruminococcaceae bacterium]|nr:glycosyltransferase family 4 protein [Oscillospiraceae bacterium]
MRILYVTTVGMTMRFFENIISKLLNDGNEVHIACNNKDGDIPEVYFKNGVTIHNIDCVRSPLKKQNITAIKQIKSLVEEYKFDIVHCHTPIAAMCTRFACRKARKEGTKVIYTAHGFHFYKGAPLKNWLIFYPIEKICSNFTDTLVTINKEDFVLAQKKMKAKCVEYVPGVGIDVASVRDVTIDVSKKREELGLPEKAFVFLSVGELNANKNHTSVIKAIAEINKSDLHYVIVGSGELKETLERIAEENGVADRVHLLGYRRDVREILKAVDAYIHPSLREGLPVSVMEALASGLPIICSKIRGNVDVVEDGKNGLHFEVSDAKTLINAIQRLYEKRDERAVGLTNSADAEKFDFSQINKKIYQLYFGTDVE